MLPWQHVGIVDNHVTLNPFDLLDQERKDIGVPLLGGHHEEALPRDQVEVEVTGTLKVTMVTMPV